MKSAIVSLCLACAASGCISSPGPGGAPAPVGRVDISRLYSGDWHEIAYRPNGFTKGCVAGLTRYSASRKPDEVRVRDSCRDKTLDGKERAINGTGHILDRGTNARMRVDYFPFVSRETRIVALAPDYAWFITSTPNFGEVNIFTRNPQPGRPLLDELTQIVKSMGYDISLLNFPPQPAG